MRMCSLTNLSHFTQSLPWETLSPCPGSPWLGTRDLLPKKTFGLRKKWDSIFQRHLG